jgi:hypothetical protein
MEVEMSDPSTLQDNYTPRETRIPQAEETAKTNKVPQVLATVAGTQISPQDSSIS